MRLLPSFGGVVLSSRALLMMMMWKFDVRRCLARLRFITNSDFIERSYERLLFWQRRTENYNRHRRPLLSPIYNVVASNYRLASTVSYETVRSKWNEAIAFPSQSRFLFTCLFISAHSILISYPHRKNFLCDSAVGRH